MTAKINRRKSREAAFSLIFEWSFHTQALEETIQNAIACRELPVDGFARALCERTIEHVDALDAIIEQYSESWKVSRLSKVTLTVLRLALCEITRMEDIPVGATINEAVELCKKFTTEDEAAYVNGILGQYSRDHSGEKSELPTEDADAGEEPEESPGEEPGVLVAEEPEAIPEEEPEPEFEQEPETELKQEPETEPEDSSGEEPGELLEKEPEKEPEEEPEEASE